MPGYARHTRTRKRNKKRHSCAGVILSQFYRRLRSGFGPQHWWPARTKFEVMVGAILTQATNWHNVELAIKQLREARALTAKGIGRLRASRLEQYVKPCGYFRQKAGRLAEFARWYLRKYQGRAGRMFRTPMGEMRDELLRQNGIGPETADSILLYAGGYAVFVVDAYTMRVFGRHRLIRGKLTYENVQQFVMENTLHSAPMYNEFHALLVAAGKKYCHRRNPDCNGCPLGSLPHTTKRG